MSTILHITHDIKDAQNSRCVWPPCSRETYIPDGLYTEVFSAIKTDRDQVDIDDSQEQQRTIIKHGVDRDLDLLKDRYNGLDGLLKQVAIDVASIIPANLQIEVNVIYFPQLGFNIAIPFDNTGRAAYMGSGGTWEQIFTTENRAYFKDERMRQLDEKLGDIYGLVCGKVAAMPYGVLIANSYVQKGK